MLRNLAFLCHIRLIYFTFGYNLPRLSWVKLSIFLSYINGHWKFYSTTHFPNLVFWCLHYFFLFFFMREGLHDLIFSTTLYAFTHIHIRCYIHNLLAFISIVRNYLNNEFRNSGCVTKNTVLMSTNVLDLFNVSSYIGLL